GLFAYILINKYVHKSIFFALILATHAYWVGVLFVQPFLYYDYPEIYYESGEGYNPPILTQTFVNLGLLQNCSRPLHFDPQLYEKLQLTL
ncbi:hypothetical protein OSK38_25780, partial [Escherichia coli]|nr:hypothetical protein [Escherichia coli]